MKRITTLLSLLILIAVGASTAKASQLYLRTNKGGPMILRISGMEFHSQWGEFNAIQVPAGHHYFTIKKRRGRGNGHHRNRGRRMLFQGNIHIPPRSTVIARVTRRGHLVVEDVIRHPRKRRVRRAPAPRWPQRGNRSGRGGQRGYGMSFDMLMQQMDRLSFESERKDLAMNFFENGDYTSQDVLEITDRFRQEKNKLDLALYAYDGVLDPENYLMVQDTFGFRHSRKVLRDHIL